MGNDVEFLHAQGLAALQAGDAATARRCLERVVASGRASASTWGALAAACHALGDRRSAAASTDRALELDPRSIPALVMKGDCLREDGDARTATGFYGAAVALADRAVGLNDSLQRLVRHAREQRDRINADIERHLLESLRRHGYDQSRSNARFSQALELLSGRRQRYLQQPRAFYYPGIPDTQFYEASLFPWLAALESATDTIAAELREVARHEGAFTPYVTLSDGGPVDPAHRMLDNPDWTAHFLWKDGAAVPGNAERCPRTLAALAGVPLARIRGRAPSILFSRLRPGARIPPHTGFLNCRLICHLPLVVPRDCRFRVGGEERRWERGRAWVFNDTIEHEACNDSDQPRIILIFDVWHPALDAEERRLVSRLMQAVDSYGKAPDWHA